MNHSKDSRDPGYAALRFGSILKEARKRKKLTQEAVAEKLGVTRFTVRNWETDANRPDYEMVPKLCALLDLSVQDLFGAETPLSLFERDLLRDVRALSPLSRQTVRRIVSVMLDGETSAKDEQLKSTCRIIELLPGGAAAGTGYEFQETAPEPFFLRTNDRNARADAVVRVSGKSMEPVYLDGDYVYFEYAKSAYPGEDVVAGWREGAVVKRVGEDRTLYSVNPDYPFRYDDGAEGVRLIGRVLGVVSSADRPDAEDEDILQELFKEELRSFYKRHGGSDS